MADISAFRSKDKQALDLSVSIIRPEVEVQPILVQLRVGYSGEEETGRPLGAQSNLEFLWVLVHHDPSERVAPPTTQRLGIVRVHNRLLPFKTHAWSVENMVLPVPQGRVGDRSVKPNATCVLSVACVAEAPISATGGSPVNAAGRPMFEALAASPPRWFRPGLGQVFVAADGV